MDDTNCSRNLSAKKYKENGSNECNLTDYSDIDKYNFNDTI